MEYYETEKKEVPLASAATCSSGYFAMEKRSETRRNADVCAHMYTYVYTYTCIHIGDPM